MDYRQMFIWNNHEQMYFHSRFGSTLAREWCDQLSHDC